MVFKKYLQERHFISGIPQGSILSPVLFLLLIVVFLDDGLGNFAIYASDTILTSKSGKAYDFWKQLEFTSGFESDLQDTVDLNSK